MVECLLRDEGKQWRRLQPERVVQDVEAAPPSVPPCVGDAIEVEVEEGGEWRITNLARSGHSGYGGPPPTLTPPPHPIRVRRGRHAMEGRRGALATAERRLQCVRRWR